MYRQAFSSRLIGVTSQYLHIGAPVSLLAHQQRPRPLALNGHRPESPLEQGPHSLMPPVEPQTVTHIQPLHRPTQIRMRRLHKQMVMIPHQNVRMELQPLSPGEPARPPRFGVPDILPADPHPSLRHFPLRVFRCGLQRKSVTQITAPDYDLRREGLRPFPPHRKHKFTPTVGREWLRSRNLPAASGGPSMTECPRIITEGIPSE